MPPAPVRLALEAACVALAAVGAWLAEFRPPLLIGAVVVACVLVVLLERASRQVATPAIVDEPVVEEPPAEPEPPQILAEARPAPLAEPEPEPELAVSERSARAILASGPPPTPEPPRPRSRVPEPAAEPAPEPTREPEPGPEPEPPAAEPPREWSIWELQRLIRERPGDPRQEEWAALVHSLRDFARADGTLPVEFDELVRDTFGTILAAERETNAAVAR